MNITKNTVIHSTDPAVYQQVVSLIILKAQILGYSTVYYIASIFLVIGAIAALFINAGKKQEKREEIMIE